MAVITRLAHSCRCAALLAVLVGLALSVPAAAGESLKPDEVEAIQGIVRDYLRKNPEVIIDALKAYEREQAQLREVEEREQLAARRDALERDPDSVVGGNPDGDITLVEFFDYRCPYCKRVLPDLVKLRAQDKNLRLVYKEFPILGEDSVIASRAAIASRAQGKYEAFHDALMASRGKLTEKIVVQIAAEVGLDVERLIDDMRAPEINDIIARNYALAQALGIRGTPTFVVGDDIIRGAVSLSELKRRIGDARSACLTC